MVDFRLANLRRKIVQSQGDHAIFSPSSSAGWLYCADYIFANHDKPDNANEDAAYGTVGHSVGEHWLEAIKLEMAKRRFRTAPSKAIIDRCEPTRFIGTVINKNGFEITIDKEMLSYVREYVEWCAELPGDHYIETRVDHSDLTPIPDQKGTADHAACEPRVLTITDLKMGRGIKVYAKDNTQGLLYAWGFFQEWDWMYGFERIVIRIAQPRIEHFDVWEITREDLIAFAKWAKERALIAWTGGTRSPGPKTCQWCKDVACAARLAVLHEETDDVFDDLTREDEPVIEGEFRVVDDRAMAVAKEALDIGWEPDPQAPSTLSTLQLEKLLRLRKLTEKWFAQIEMELEARAEHGEELTLWKLVDGRPGNRSFDSPDGAEALAEEIGVDPMLLYKVEMLSPAQFEEVVRQELGITKKKAGELIAAAVIRKQGKKTLAPVKDARDAVGSSGDVFDDLTLIEGL